MVDQRAVFTRRSITSSEGDHASNTARKKVLQTTTLMTVRAMRSIFCEVLLARPSPFLFRGPPPTEVFKAASNAFVAEEQRLGGVGPIQVAASLRNGFYAHQPQATRSLVADRGSNLLLPLPRISVLTGCRVLRPSASLYGRAACSGRPSGPSVLEVADSAGELGPLCTILHMDF